MYLRTDYIYIYVYIYVCLYCSYDYYTYSNSDIVMYMYCYMTYYTAQLIIEVEEDDNNTIYIVLVQPILIPHVSQCKEYIVRTYT